MEKKSEKCCDSEHRHQVRIIKIPKQISGKQLVEAIVLPIVKGVVIGIVVVVDRFAFTAQNDNDRIKIFSDDIRSTFASKTIISSTCKLRLKERIEKQLKKTRTQLARSDIIGKFSHRICESLAAASAATSAAASSAGRR